MLLSSRTFFGGKFAALIGKFSRIFSAFRDVLTDVFGTFWREFERYRAKSAPPLRDRKMDEWMVCALKVSLPLTVFCAEVDFFWFITVMFSDHHEACRSWEGRKRCRYR